jgi:hypothetical protein
MNFEDWYKSENYIENEWKKIEERQMREFRLLDPFSTSISNIFIETLNLLKSYTNKSPKNDNTTPPSPSTSDTNRDS